MFVSDEHGSILLHKPHPQKELKAYQIKQLIEILEQEGLIWITLFNTKAMSEALSFPKKMAFFMVRSWGIRSLISYEGESAKELLDDFHGAIDDYLETCKAEGKEPEVAFKGSFNIRLSPDLHKKLFIYTTAHQMSMNKYIEDTLKDSPAARVVV